MLFYTCSYTMWVNTAQFVISWFHKLLQTKTWGDSSENTQSVIGTTTLLFFFRWIVYNKHTYNYMSQNIQLYYIASRDFQRYSGTQVDTWRQQLSNTPKPFLWVTYASALTFILPHHRGFPANALAEVDYPSALPALATSCIPPWRGQSHSPEGGVPTGGGGKFGQGQPGFSLLFFNLRLFWFMGSESCPDNLNGH